MENNLLIFKNHFLKILINNKNFKNIIITPKKNINKSHLRIRMRRKIRFLLKLIHNNEINFIFIIKEFFDFKINEYKKIQKKINKCLQKKLKK